MSSEYLFALVVLLLPVAALSGWYYARRDAAAAAERRDRHGGMSADYFRGLNYLLNDRPDKAIDVFIKVLEVESETVETHLALGNLFRRRGEVDRAIRIHQNLVARPALDGEQRARALLELGLDYMRSGLLDRAEGLFRELTEARTLERQALGHLIEIYQQEQDWDKALDHIRRLERATGEDLARVEAHFLCEQAQGQIREHQDDHADRLLQAALKVDARCVRASLLAANLARARGHHARAIALLKNVEHQDVDFLSEAIGPLVASYRAIGDIDGLAQYLERLSALHAGVTPVLVLAELAAERQSIDAAKSYIIRELRVRPSIRGIDRLIDYSLRTAAGEGRENLILLKDTTARLLEDKLSYKCGNCGFTGRSLHWQCPGCKFWNSVKPIHGIEGE